MAESGVNVVEDYRGVVTAGGQEGSVMRKCDGLDLAIVWLERGQELATRKIPEANPTIQVTRRHLITGGRERHEIDSPGVAHQALDPLPRGHIPKRHTVPRRGQGIAVRRKGRRADLKVVCQTAEHRPCREIPQLHGLVVAATDQSPPVR